MKKQKMKTMLTALLLLLGIFMSAQTVIRKGDANGDGKVNAADIVEVVNYLQNKMSESFSFLSADMNKDGQVDKDDLTSLVNLIFSSDAVIEEDQTLTNLLLQQRTGAYEGLFYQSAYPSSMFYFVSCLASDEMLGGGGFYDPFGKIDLLTDNPTTADAWNGYLTNIRNTNDAIKAIQALKPERDAHVRHAMGETLFLRAFYYHQMASLFGIVPVITDNDSWEQRMKTATPADIWGQILLDLKEAIKLMEGYSPTLQGDDGRVGKYAAEALLARAYLFYTGFYLGLHDIASVSNSDSNITPVTF